MPPTTAFILGDKTPNLKAQVKSVFPERGLMQRTGQEDKVENGADGRVLLKRLWPPCRCIPVLHLGAEQGEGKEREALGRGWGLCLWSVLLSQDGVFALLGWPRALQQLQHTHGSGIRDSVCLDAPREINIANCLPCLKPSLLRAWHYRQAFNQTVQGQLCFSSKHIWALQQEQKAWQCFFSLSE